MVSPENKGTILYVEDNPDNRLLVRRVLLSEDYSLLEATDAAKQMTDLALMSMREADPQGEAGDALFELADRLLKRSQ